MTSAEIRDSFLDFFRSKDHTIVPSSPVIPFNDPTLLFTNAGMNQFKDVFLGTGTRPYKRAADTQKCIRVSGKHNDLEEVGRDTYHHTFFEMLGNWSFGDYYKKEAIAWAWELLTKVWKLPKHRLWATVYTNDDEAEELWKKVTDIDHTHVLRFGEKDNFWEMGETGPCGPCSEIHIDRTPNATATASMVNAGLADVMEIWNLVFIQFNRDENGTLTPLPAKHVDTGMGFERICSVIQGKKSNYDTDVFSPLIKAICEITMHKYTGTLPSKKTSKQEDIDVAIRVIADHVRTLTFAIGDGALPSNEGRGYVLRRILRRAARFGRILEMHDPFIYQLVPVLVSTMSYIFPEIKQHQDHIQKIIKGEEEAFNATLDRGLERFEEYAQKAIKENSGIINGDDVFRLYDTFGFPLDLTALLAQEKGLKIDTDQFSTLMEEQRKRSREAGKTTAEKQTIPLIFSGRIKEPTTFVGYNNFECTATVIDQLDNFVVLDRTPFYGESGGQVGDTGILKLNNTTISVTDTQKDGEIIIHCTENSYPSLIGSTVVASIDAERRRSIMRNHSATHLLHNALRRVLGTHVHQAGSYVAPDYLRFDFAHYSKLSEDELKAIEDLVNDKIAENIPRTPNLQNIPFEKAKKLGALMFFGEKYGERVNVIQFGDFSIEFCGGTHVQSTGEIGFFKIISESSIASGVRRIEAVTHQYALDFLKLQNTDLKETINTLLKEIDDLLSQLNPLQSSNPDFFQKTENDLKLLQFKIESHIKQIPTEAVSVSIELRQHFNTFNSVAREIGLLQGEIINIRKAINKELSRLSVLEKESILDSLLQSSKIVHGYKLVTGEVQVDSIDDLKKLGDSLRLKLHSGVGVLASVIDNKIQLVCVVTDDLVTAKKADAGKIVKEVAKHLQGGGGGKPHLATAGGKDISKLKDVLAYVESFLN